MTSPERPPHPLQPSVSSAPSAPPVTWLDHTGSTQHHVLEAATADPADWPHLRAVATLDQRTGRGRHGRGWNTPPGTALAFSVVLRPPVPVQHFSWITLLAASEIVAELERRGVPATVKWPNDILATDGRKLCGILAGVLPRQSGVVLGIGVNLGFGDDGAPVPTATALADWVPGLTADGDTRALAQDLLEAVLSGLGAALAGFAREIAADPDAGPGREVDGRHPAVRAVVGHLGTLGTEVRAELPGGGSVSGVARGLGPGGTLLIEPAGHGKMDVEVPGTTRRGGLLEVSAADVVHLRR